MPILCTAEPSAHRLIPNRSRFDDCGPRQQRRAGRLRVLWQTLTWVVSTTLTGDGVSRLGFEAVCGLTGRHLGRLRSVRAGSVDRLEHLAGSPPE